MKKNYNTMLTNKKSAKLSGLLSGKIEKYEYLTGEEILPSDQSIIIAQIKFTYFLLSKAFEKQIKTIRNKKKNKLKIQNFQNLIPKQ